MAARFSNGIVPPADGDGEERDVLGAALLLHRDGGLQSQTHAVALVGQLHVQPVLWAQAAQPHLALHRVRLPALLHHSHQLRGLVRLRSYAQRASCVRNGEFCGRIATVRLTVIEAHLQVCVGRILHQHDFGIFVVKGHLGSLGFHQLHKLGRVLIFLPVFF